MKLLFSALALLGLGAVQARETVAILDVVNPTGQLTALSGYLADEISLKEAQDTAVSIVERGQLSRILNEQGLQNSGAFDVKTIARIGTLSGASRVVSGRYYPIGDEFEVVIRTVDVASGEAVKIEKRKFRRIESLIRLDAVLAHESPKPAPAAAAVAPVAAAAPVLPVPAAPAPVPTKAAVPAAVASAPVMPAVAKDSWGPIRLKVCRQGVHVVCSGEVMSALGGKILIKADETYADFESGIRGDFWEGPEIAGTSGEVVQAGVKQSIRFKLNPRKSGTLGGIRKFSLVYLFNGKEYRITSAPPMK